MLMHKGNFFDHFFVSSCGEISQLVILGTLSIPCYGYQKVWYQLRENFGVYLHAKKNRDCPFLLSWNVAKILQTCYFAFFEMPGHTHQKQ